MPQITDMIWFGIAMGIAFLGASGMIMLTIRSQQK